MVVNFHWGLACTVQLSQCTDEKKFNVPKKGPTKIKVKEREQKFIS